MPNPWKDERISRELRKTGHFSTETGASEKTWLQIETRLARREKHFWNLMAWKPWAHPGGWITLAACLCLSLTGALCRLNQMDNDDFDSYLITMSHPTVDMAPEGIKPPFLFSEEPPAADFFLSDEDH